jgi:hypothetical protein
VTSLDQSVGFSTRADPVLRKEFIDADSSAHRGEIGRLCSKHSAGSSPRLSCSAARREARGVRCQAPQGSERREHDAGGLVDNPLAHITHKGFYYNRRYATATSLHAALRRAGGRARHSVGRHTVSSMPPFFVAALARLA